MRKLFATIGSLALVLATVGQVHAIPLSDLFDGGSIQIGDKLFSSFQPLGGIDYVSVNTDNIEVTGVGGGGQDFGLHFDILNDEFKITGNDISTSYTRLFFDYQVSVLDPSFKINGSSLDSFDLGVQWLNDGSNSSGGLIYTQLNDYSAYPYYLGELQFDWSVQDDIFTDFLNDSAFFDPRSQLLVSMGLEVWSTDSTDYALLNSFSQRFSQVPVPEPSTFLLLGSGLVGLAFAIRRRKKE